LKEKGSEEAIMHSRKSDEDEMSVESCELSVCMSMIQKIDAIIGVAAISLQFNDVDNEKLSHPRPAEGRIIH
jgi:hypothetical protein